MFHDFIRALLLLHLSFTYRGKEHYGEGELARLGLLTAEAGETGSRAILVSWSYICKYRAKCSNSFSLPSECLFKLVLLFMITQGCVKKKVPQPLTQPASDLIMPYANDVLKRSSQSLTSSQLTYFLLVTVRVGETKLYQIYQMELTIISLTQQSFPIIIYST